MKNKAYVFLAFCILTMTGCVDFWMDSIGGYDPEFITYSGTAAEVDKDGGWIIDNDYESMTYGCSIYIMPHTVRKQIFKMSIDNSVPKWEGTINPDFEPRWIKFEPMNHTFSDTITLGISFEHLPHDNYLIMQIVEYLPESNSFKVVSKDGHSDAAVHHDVTQLGIFAVFPGGN